MKGGYQRSCLPILLWSNFTKFVKQKNTNFPFQIPFGFLIIIFSYRVHLQLYLCVCICVTLCITDVCRLWVTHACGGDIFFNSFIQTTFLLCSALFCTAQMAACLHLINILSFLRLLLLLTMSMSTSIYISHGLPLPVMSCWVKCMNIFWYLTLINLNK